MWSKSRSRSEPKRKTNKLNDRGIVAATKNAAEFLRIPNAGTVASGNSADFIVLEANPLDDITNTRRIRDVYLRGEHIDRSAY